jgi:hypothetical protein
VHPDKCFKANQKTDNDSRKMSLKKEISKAPVAKRQIQENSLEER